MALLDIYRKEFIGKKKHAWTFIDLEVQKKKSRSIYYVICLCNCGSIYRFTPAYCAAIQFPYNCVDCNKNREFKPASEVDIQVYIDELENSEREDDKKVLENIKDFYARYYRD